MQCCTFDFALPYFLWKAPEMASNSLNLPGRMPPHPLACCVSAVHGNTITPLFGNSLPLPLSTLSLSSPVYTYNNFAHIHAKFIILAKLTAILKAMYGKPEGLNYRYKYTDVITNK